MLVKDTAGNDVNVASSGKGNAALTLGIIGTALGAMAGGLGGLGGSGTSVLGSTNAAAVAQDVVAAEFHPTPVTEREYYHNTIDNMKEFFNYAQGVCSRICDLEQRVAVDETAISKNFEFMDSQNEWQNKYYDEKFHYADLLEQCRISDATCRCIKGDVYASPSTIADPYVGTSLLLGSAQVLPNNYVPYNYYGGYPYANGIGYNGWGTYGYNTGCSCGC
jgi:hypothetical protein